MSEMPVGFFIKEDFGWVEYPKTEENTHAIPLYAHKKEWKGFTEKEFIYYCHWVDAATLADIEKDLMEKNT
jgi:hypothetical protein